jgi:hypothetical protein
MNWEGFGSREERLYSSYSFSTSVLDGGGWSASRPGRALAPGKGPPVPIVQEAGWASEPVWTQRLEEKSFHFCRGSNLDRPVVQLVARHYNNWAIPGPLILRYYPVIRPEGLRETTINLSQDIRSPDRDLNPWPHEHEAGVLTILPRR